MSQLAFTLSVPKYVAADIGAMIDVGNEVVRLVRKQFPINDGVTLLEVSTSNSAITTDPTITTKEATGAAAGAITMSGILATSTLVKVYSANFDPTALVATAAGGAAGNIAITGPVATSELKSVVAIKDDDQTVADLTAEFTASGTNQINNTGGTDTTGYHLVVTYHAVDSTTLTNLTSEFRVSAANTIDNTGGTTTAGKQVIATWTD